MKPSHYLSLMRPLLDQVFQLALNEFERTQAFTPSRRVVLDDLKKVLGVERLRKETFNGIFEWLTHLNLSPQANAFCPDEISVQIDLNNFVMSPDQCRQFGQRFGKVYPKLNKLLMLS